MKRSSQQSDGVDNLQFNQSSGSLSRNSTGGQVSSVEVLPQFKGSTASSLSPEKLQDGAVLLGRNGPSGNTYVTRYAINRKRQRADLCNEVLRGAFYPCTLAENRESLLKLLWTIISSEAFVFTLHMTVLVLGVAKEALNLRTVDEELHFIHSLIETFVAGLMIIIQVANVHQRFKSIRECVTAVEHVEEPTSDNIRGKDLRKWLLRFYVLGAFLLVLIVTCFLLFYYLVHLGWTILSNNFALVAITVSSNLLLDRLGNVIARITEDQHKAVIFETVLLLQEAYNTTIQSKEKREAYFERVRRFSKAIMDTELFERPEHIEMSEKLKPRWDTFTTMEMQSFV